MALWQHYHRPTTIEEALAYLAEHDGRARVVAGGTDLLLEMQQGHKPAVAALVDVSAVAEMTNIRLHEGWLEVGAAVTHTEIVKSPLVRQYATCLVESCGVIGGPQVRNVATLGGNVAHALPAADGTTALVALDAEAEVATVEGRSWRPILSLFKGAGVSAVDQSREMITCFRFAAGPAQTATAFKRIMRPQGVALPILACAVWVEVASGEGQGEAYSVLRIPYLEGSNTQYAIRNKSEIPNPNLQSPISNLRICIGPVKTVPCRAEGAEEVLRGRSLEEGLEGCVAAAQAELSPRTSKHRATADYRREMIAVLLRRTLPLAVERAISGTAIPEGIGL